MIGGLSPVMGLGMFLFTTVSRPAKEPTQPPIKCSTKSFSLVVKRLGRVANNSHPSSTEFKNEWSYTSAPSLRLHGVVLSYSTGTILPYLTRWGWVLRFTHRPLYHQEKSPRYPLDKRCIGPRVGMEAEAKRNIPVSPGYRTRLAQPVVYSLYWLSCHGSIFSQLSAQ